MTDLEPMLFLFIEAMAGEAMCSQYPCSHPEHRVARFLRMHTSFCSGNCTIQDCRVYAEEKAHFDSCNDPRCIGRCASLREQIKEHLDVRLGIRRRVLSAMEWLSLGDADATQRLIIESSEVDRPRAGSSRCSEVCPVCHSDRKIPRASMRCSSETCDNTVDINCLVGVKDGRIFCDSCSSSPSMERAVLRVLADGTNCAICHKVCGPTAHASEDPQCVVRRLRLL